MSHRVFKIAFLPTLVFILSACTPATFQKLKTPKPIKSEITVVIPKDKENKTIWIRNDNSDRSNKNIQVVNQEIAETFYAAAIYGKRNGYKYFALTNGNVNNLNGFPINTLDNLIGLYQFEEEDAKKYYKPRQLVSQGHGKSIFDVNTIRLQLQYFKKPIPGLFFFNINKVIQQADKYISN